MSHRRIRGAGLPLLFLLVVPFSLFMGGSAAAQSGTRLQPAELSSPPGASADAIRPVAPVSPFALSVPGSTQELLGQGSRRGRRRILLTGYWPPTNHMLRQFSPRPQQNPGGWRGGNWEGRGYDVYAFFPEFADPDCTICGRGMGDLEVDYQDTSQDFWLIADAVKPVAVITFSRGNNNRSWEVELNQFNRTTWINDYRIPFQPTPSPPDSSVPAEFLRPSTLPVNAIVDAVNAAGALNINAFPCVAGDGGGFLSEFIAYHGVWYQALHSSPDDPAYCVSAGHVHVGGRLSAEATEAAKITVRTVIEHVNSILGPPGGEVASCGPGAVNAGCGNPENVLFVNGSSGSRARTVYLRPSDPLSVMIREPSSSVGDGMPTRLCVYAWPGLSSPADQVMIPKGLGPMCFGPLSIATRTPVRIWNSIGSVAKLGAHDAPGAPPVIPDGGSAVLFSRPGGAGIPVTLTLQGVVEDPCSQGTVPYSITNGIALIVD